MSTRVQLFMVSAARRGDDLNVLHVLFKQEVVSTAALRLFAALLVFIGAPAVLPRSEHPDVTTDLCSDCENVTAQSSQQTTCTRL